MTSTYDGSSWTTSSYTQTTKTIEIHFTLDSVIISDYHNEDKINDTLMKLNTYNFNGKKFRYKMIQFRIGNKAEIYFSIPDLPLYSKIISQLVMEEIIIENIGRIESRINPCGRITNAGFILKDCIIFISKVTKKGILI